MWKKIGLGLLVLVLILGGAGWYLFANLDHFVKTAIEKYGSAATQANVTVDSVALSLSSGQGTISGLVVGNPRGFYTPYALSIGTITVQADTNSLTGNGPVIINEIDIKRPQVIYEVNDKRQSAEPFEPQPNQSQQPGRPAKERAGLRCG